MIYLLPFSSCGLVCRTWCLRWKLHRPYRRRRLQFRLGILPGYDAFPASKEPAKKDSFHAKHWKPQSCQWRFFFQHKCVLPLFLTWLESLCGNFNFARFAWKFSIFNINERKVPPKRDLTLFWCFVRTDHMYMCLHG